MKNIIIGVWPVLALGASPSHVQAQVINPQPPINEKETRETLYRDFLLSELSPCIQIAIDDYYNGPAHSFILSQAKIKDIKRLCGKGQFYFEATVVVETFTGAHTPTNELDTITLTNFPPSKAAFHPYAGQQELYVLKFEHNKINPSDSLPIRRNC